MLASPSVVAAAKACGVTSKTAHQWLLQPGVTQALKMARQKMLDDSMHTLQQCSQFAVSALLRNVSKDAPPAMQIRAAEIILEYALKYTQIETLAERVTELEALLGNKPLRLA